VPSIKFPNHVHLWRLSQILQEGRDRTHDSLLNSWARAASYIVITAHDRLFGNYFSVYDAVLSLWTGFVKLFDIILGMLS
jgi:hypothetical protein